MSDIPATPEQQEEDTYLDALAAQDANIMPEQEMIYSDDLIRWQLDTSPITKEIFYRLSGYIWDEEKQQYFPPTQENLGNPLLNEYGVSYIMSCVKSLCHKELNLSNLDDDHIKGIVYDVVYRDILPAIVTNWHIFGQPDRHEIRLIRTIIETNVLVILRRAFGDKERQLLKSQLKVGETRIVKENAEQKDSRGWSKLF